MIIHIDIIVGIAYWLGLIKRKLLRGANGWQMMVGEISATRHDLSTIFSMSAICMTISSDMQIWMLLLGHNSPVWTRMCAIRLFLMIIYDILLLSGWRIWRDFIIIFFSFIFRNRTPISHIWSFKILLLHIVDHKEQTLQKACGYLQQFLHWIFLYSSKMCENSILRNDPKYFVLAQSSYKKLSLLNISGTRCIFVTNVSVWTIDA